MPFINRLTGQEPTPEEWAAIEQRAAEILQNPYASPEQVEWALMVAPPGAEMAFWESTNDRRMMRSR